jgi:zinc/manganese transport system substrate-binding protein
MTRVIKILVIGTLLSAALAACGAPPAGAGSGNTLQVIAGENFWGSIAAPLGGAHVSVTSIVSNPNTDPHEYESSAVDARAFATADYVILNGAGYDDWGRKLLSANPSTSRRVLTVADLLNKKPGDNPHFWYNPDWVDRVADKITSDYRALDPTDAAYFTQQREAFATALKPYHDAIAQIRASSSGVPVGSTESIFAYMATYLGLNLISPPAFMDAVAEGNDPPASAVINFQNQITTKQVKVLVYNVQTATAVTTNVKHLAALASIPTVGVSETLQPESATFQEWQVSQLVALQNALNASAPGA